MLRGGILKQQVWNLPSIINEFFRSFINRRDIIRDLLSNGGKKSTEVICNFGGIRGRYTINIKRFY